jgi:branched-chain amino acid transport system permease protein
VTAGAILLASALPLLGTSYHLFQCTLVVIYAIALLGLNLLTGYGGQISLGHGAFYGIGAYTTAILVHQAHVPYWLTLPCAGGVCLALGFLFGLPAVRLEGLHLALATFALGVVFPQILKSRGLERLTGGVQGISLERIDAPLGLPLSPDQWLYCVSVVTALILFVAAHNLMRSHTGRVIVAIRDRPVAATSVGVDTARYKSLTFGLSAMYTGIAGGLGRAKAADSHTRADPLHGSAGLGPFCDRHGQDPAPQVHRPLREAPARRHAHDQALAQHAAHEVSRGSFGA